jgi:hypothetical protein
MPLMYASAPLSLSVYVCFFFFFPATARRHRAADVLQRSRENGAELPELSQRRGRDVLRAVLAAPSPAQRSLLLFHLENLFCLLDLDKVRLSTLSIYALPTRKS